MAALRKIEVPTLDGRVIESTGAKHKRASCSVCAAGVKSVRGGARRRFVVPCGG